MYIQDVCVHNTKQGMEMKIESDKKSDTILVLDFIYDTKHLTFSHFWCN